MSSSRLTYTQTTFDTFKKSPVAGWRMLYLVTISLRPLAPCRCLRKKCMDYRIGGLGVISVEVRSYA